MTAALGLVVPLLGAAAKKSSGSPALLIVVVIVAGFYFLIYRPQQRKAKVLREQTKSFDVGDEVLTAGGIVGHIIDIEGDRITLETSVGASFVVLRQYVLRKLEEPEGTDEDETDEADDNEVAYDDEEHETGGEGSEPTGHEENSATEEHPAGYGGAGADGDESHGPDVPPII
jgi:preprotein translocase subunit YajC